MILRPRQIEFRDKCIKALLRHRNTLAIAPTGSGKSCMASAVAGSGYKNALILQHRDKLVEQNRNTFRLVNPKLETDIFCATRKRFLHHGCTFGMVQTLMRDQNMERMLPVDILVVDEAHHVAAESYQKIIEKAKSLNPDVHVFGVTATPERADKKALRNTFSNVADVIGLGELIRTGNLVRPRTFVIDCGLRDDLKKVHVTASDFDMDEVAAIMDKMAVNERVVEEWKRVAHDRPTVVFCSNIEHAQHVCEAFRSEGITADVIHSKLSEGEKKTIYRNLYSFKTQVFINVAIATEGFDFPPLSCVILLRPCSHKSTMIQMIGRGLRTLEIDKYPKLVKDDCVAEGQMILTDKGLVAIEKVTLEMKVWDGVDFVSHCGIQFRGYQETIEYAGLTATPDHKVWTKQGWKQIQECAEKGISICITGNDGKAVRESEGNFRNGGSHKRSKWCISSILKNHLHGMRERRVESSRYIKSENCWMSKMWTKAQHFKAVLRSSSLVDYAMCFSKAAMPESKKFVLQELWRSWNIIQIQFTELNGKISYGGIQDFQGISNRSNRQQWSLRAGELKSDYHYHKHEQSKVQWRESKNAFISRIVSIGKICGQHPCATYLRGVFLSGNKRQIFPPTFNKTKRRVWDILNAGPRHRFTCEGLLVSNCIVLDFGYSILTHGNLDVDVDIDPKKREARSLICPKCEGILPPRVYECPFCGHELQRMEGSAGGEQKERGELRDFSLTEVELLDISPYKWEELWEGYVTFANGLTAWACCIFYRGRWIAVGFHHGAAVHIIANSSERIITLAAADDYLRKNGDGTNARKTRSWLSAPPTDAQNEKLGISRMGQFGLSRYRASCMLEWKWNERYIRNKVQEAA